MILAVCGGKGNWVKDAEGLTRAESREGSGRCRGWTGKRGDGDGWMATGRRGRGRGNLEMGNGEGDNVRRWRGGQ